MITVSLLVVLLIAAVIAVKYGKAKIATLVLGVCVGLAMASTEFGSWSLTALNDLINSLFNGANEMAGS